jgi:hypothetical protein
MGKFSEIINNFSQSLLSSTDCSNTQLQEILKLITNSYEILQNLRANTGNKEEKLIYQNGRFTEIQSNSQIKIDSILEETLKHRDTLSNIQSEAYLIKDDLSNMGSTLSNSISMTINNEIQPINMSLSILLKNTTDSHSKTKIMFNQILNKFNTINQIITILDNQNKKLELK